MLLKMPFFLVGFIDDISRYVTVLSYLSNYCNFVKNFLYLVQGDN